MRILLFSILSILLLPAVARSEQCAICIDDSFDDWDSVDPICEDAIGDGYPYGVDFGRLWAADDERFLYLRFELGSLTDLSETNGLRLYIDTDMDETTGVSFNGIGADLVWYFGYRLGRFFYQGQETYVWHPQIRFRGAPSVTSSEFEIAVGRDARPDGVHPLISGSQIRVALHDSSHGDQIPEEGEVLVYTLDEGALPPEVPRSFDRHNPDDLRMVTFNVLQDAPWLPGNAERFGRLLGAVQPDIIALQEIYNHSAAQSGALVEAWLPSEPGQQWHAVRVNDCHVVSRYPVQNTWSLDGNAAVLLDTTQVLSTGLLLINVHLPCCSYEEPRQQEIDRIMAFVRDAKSPRGAVDLEPNTPIVLAGDTNLVGHAQQLTTLLTGDIVDESVFGDDFAPDWDCSDFANLISRQSELRMGYTWRSDEGDYWPGHLDYFIYTDSVLSAANHFMVYTPNMSPETLSLYGLQATDSLVCDHLLFCADFRPSLPLPGDFNNDRRIDLADFSILCGCLTGPEQGPLEPDCELTDLTQDDDADLGDVAEFMRLFRVCP